MSDSKKKSKIEYTNPWIARMNDRWEEKKQRWEEKKRIRLEEQRIRSEEEKKLSEEEDKYREEQRVRSEEQKKLEGEQRTKRLEEQRIRSEEQKKLEGEQRKQRSEEYNKRLGELKRSINKLKENNEWMNSVLSENYSQIILSHLPGYLKKVIGQKSLAALINRLLPLLLFFEGFKIAIARTFIYGAYVAACVLILLCYFVWNFSFKAGISVPIWLTLLLIFVVIRNFQKRIKYFDAYKKTEQKLEYSELKLLALTKSKIHNIRNNFNTLNALIATKKFETLEKFVENSAFYYSQYFGKNLSCELPYIQALLV